MDGCEIKKHDQTCVFVNVATANGAELSRFLPAVPN